MQTLRKNTVGLVVGKIMALAHLGWLILIALGWAKPMMDMVLKLHRISLSYSLLPFSFKSGIGLLVYTFVAGYVLGWVFAAIWNKVQK